MQFQVAVISMGYKAADYFKKFPGRFISAHLADWSPQKNNNVAIGKGIVNWKEFFASAVPRYERYFCRNGSDTFKDSVVYLNSL